MPVSLAAEAYGNDECNIYNLMPAYWEFQRTAQGKPGEDQARLFRDIVQQPNAAVYEAVFASSRKPLAVRLQRWQEWIADIQPRMRQITDSLVTELPELVNEFRSTFPAFECSVPVYFLVSVGNFDGATRSVDGQTVLLFGVDMIALYYGDHAKPLVSHELFHVYHEQAVREFPEAVYWGLWAEGLASYVSGMLNPDVPAEKICCLPEAEPIEAVLPEVVPALLSVLDSSEPSDYEEFFIGGTDTGFPQRSGYYLGYRIAERLGETRTLDQLARLSPAEVRVLAEQQLHELLARHVAD